MITQVLTVESSVEENVWILSQKNEAWEVNRPPSHIFSLFCIHKGMYVRICICYYMGWKLDVVWCFVQGNVDTMLVSAGNPHES